MASIGNVVPPQYQAPVSAPGMPVGGVVDPNTGNAQAQATDRAAHDLLAEAVVLLQGILVELQLANELMHRGVNFDKERHGRLPEVN